MTDRVIIVGAGPYGLATAAHLRHAGVDVHVLGEPLSFWRQHMPVGMFLRSSPSASNISDPERRLTVARHARARGSSPSNPLPLDDFLEYAEWFRTEAGIEVDRRRVARVERADGGFHVHLGDGKGLEARRVVVAAGIAPFASSPPLFARLGAPKVVHSVDVRETESFRGRRVVVVGAGQSALETAALLHEVGAEVELVARAKRIRWIPVPADGGALNRIARRAYAPTEVGPRGLSWVAAVPDVFRRLPERVQAEIGPTCIAPMGAYWLPPRLRDVRFTLDRSIVASEAPDGRVVLSLDDGTSREVDRVVLATGFRVDVSRYDFLAPELLRSIELANGAPVLSTGLESSVPGLHFVGATASFTFGPVMRFVVGTAYAAPAVVRRVLGRSPKPLMRAW